MRRRQRSEVVYVERGADSSAKWLFWGALLGAGLALMYAPSSGEETRRNLQRKLWKLRAMTEEKLDEITQQFGGAKDSLEGLMGDEDEDIDDEGEDRTMYGRNAGATPREELERRLADARARRRSPADLEEPLA
jgi:gas vesicle protein